MLEKFEKYFARLNADKNKPGQADQADDIITAACALFLEIAHVDGEFSEGERENILKILIDEYHLSEDDALKITRTAEEERKSSIQLWGFTNLINTHYSREEKIRVIELIWKIIYTDGKLDKYEDYLVHKLANLLKLSHRDLIDAKLKILNEKL